jgi:chorismate mutase
VRDRIAELRRAITANDESIVAAVNERLRLVSELWEIKAHTGADRIDPERERALRATLAAANKGPLSAEGLNRLVDELLDLTKQELAALPEQRSR